MNREKFGKLIEYCRGKNVFIQTHNFPDPDALASAFGLQKIFEYYNIPTTLCYEGNIDKISSQKMLHEFNITIYPQKELVMTADDPIICVDSQKHGGNITDFIGDEIACIDHHPTKVEVEYMYKDVRMVGSCATLIADYFKTLGITPSTAVSTALLYGIKMDTLQFSRGVTSEDIDAFAFLFPLCDSRKLMYMKHNNMEYSDLMAYGEAIKNIRVYDNIGIAGIEMACPDGLIATLADFILSLMEVDIAILYSNRGDEIKFSVRSEGDIDSGALISKALEGIGNGGGHAVMAGGRIPLTDGRTKPSDSVIQNRFLKTIGEMRKAGKKCSTEISAAT